MPLLRALSASTAALWDYPKFFVVTSWEVQSHIPQGKKKKLLAIIIPLEVVL